MIAVIGGGPAGSYFSSLMNKDVTIFEEHERIGRPVACTGIITSAIMDLVNLDENVIVNYLDKVRVIGWNKETEFKLKDGEIVVDREKFDKFLAERAVENGVKFKLNHRFIGCKNNTALFKNKNSVLKYKYDSLVGADGPGSLVARENNLMLGRKYWVGKQYKIKMKCNKNEFIVFFGEIPDFFGWIVPENSEYARVGVASEKFSGKYFSLLAKRLGLRERDFIECQSGLIPQYNPGMKTSRGDVYLIGDAAGHVKATTGGGIVYGMRGAKCLANALTNNKDYEKLWRKDFGRELWFHLKVRKFLNKLDKKGYDELVSRLKGVDLGSYNRDYPFRSIGLLMHPGLIWMLIKTSVK